MNQNPVVLVYLDDGPSGPCGQSMSITSPHTRVHIFEDEDALREWSKDKDLGPNKARRKSQIRVCGLPDEICNTVVVHEPQGGE